MKKIALYIGGAILAELAIIIMTAVAGLTSSQFSVAIAILPAGLFLAAIYYIFFKAGKDKAEEKENKGSEADK